MRLCYFFLDGDRHFGMRTNEGFLDLDIACRDFYATKPVKGADPSRFRDMKTFLSGGAESVALANTIQEYIETRRKSGWTPRAATGARFFFKTGEKIAYLPPILPGAKLFCLSANSLAQAREMGRDPPKRPQVFARFTNTLAGHEQPLFLMAPNERPEVDLELGVVLMKGGRKIPKEAALDHIAGFTVAHTVSYRGLEFPEPGGPSDWVMGRGLDYSLSVGPGIVARDEIADPKGRKMELKVNGVVRQSGSTDDYLFTVADVVHHLSQGITLEAGDFVSLGTIGSAPGFEFGKPERQVKPGDVIEGSIDGVGTLKNVIASEPAAGAPLKGG